MRTVLTIAATAVALWLTPALVAQDRSQEQPPSANASAKGAGEERPRFQMANVRIEIAVTDSVTGSAPKRKPVTMIIADGQMGRIRAERGGANVAQFYVDATPTIVGDVVRLQVSLNYSPPASTPGAANRFASLTEVVTVLLQPGKPTVISQSADPTADRNVSVEVTATILK